MLFAAHESFHIRDGWLRKGLLGIRNDPLLFAKQFATDELGVGHNMVAAIRYWLQATDLAHASTETVDGRRVTRLEWTALAKLIVDHDPYFEAEGTLWVLHYHLATNERLATTWYWFFNRFGVRQFTQDLFLSHLHRFVDSQGKRRISPRSLEKDLRCFVRTYARTQDTGSRTNPEDSFDCPLSALGLLEFLPLTKSYHALTPAPELLDPLLVGYALAQMRVKWPMEGSNITFRDALYAEGSPGRIFLFDAELLYSFLGRLESDERLLTFARTAGLDLVTLKERNPEEILGRYYARVGATV